MRLPLCCLLALLGVAVADFGGDNGQLAPCRAGADAFYIHVSAGMSMVESIQW